MTQNSSLDTAGPPLGWNTEIPHSARVYDYMLGGKDNYPPDREVGDELLAAMPFIRGVVRANRAFLQRAVRFAAEVGISQFLDLGAGLPTSPSTHEVARAVDPDARVAYVDSDPILLSHARTLLPASGGRIALAQADVREPDRTLDLPELQELLDFDRPMALMLIGLMHLFGDEHNPYGMVARYVERLASGSYVLFSQFTADFSPETAGELERISADAGEPVAMRTAEQVARFADGLDLVDPGVVQMPYWRPDGALPADSEKVFLYAWVARKP
ncbi:SAM-dependent methyltransferase [Labedaea rhizosphaerae]|nr:SAM-dependent methyltransferase [Labedaea rhizosphaerae]